MALLPQVVQQDIPSTEHSDELSTMQTGMAEQKTTEDMDIPCNSRHIQLQPGSDVTKPKDNVDIVSNQNGDNAGSSQILDDSMVLEDTNQEPVTDTQNLSLQNICEELESVFIFKNVKPYKFLQAIVQYCSDSSKLPGVWTGLFDGRHTAQSECRKMTNVYLNLVGGFEVYKKNNPQAKLKTNADWRNGYVMKFANWLGPNSKKYIDIKRIVAGLLIKLFDALQTSSSPPSMKTRINVFGKKVYGLYLDLKSETLNPAWKQKIRLPHEFIGIFKNGLLIGNEPIIGKECFTDDEEENVLTTASTSETFNTQLRKQIVTTQEKLVNNETKIGICENEYELHNSAIITKTVLLESLQNERQLLLQKRGKEITEEQILDQLRKAFKLDDENNYADRAFKFCRILNEVMQGSRSSLDLLEMIHETCEERGIVLSPPFNNIVDVETEVTPNTNDISQGFIEDCVMGSSDVTMNKVVGDQSWILSDSGYVSTNVDSENNVDVYGADASTINVDDLIPSI